MVESPQSGSAGPRHRTPPPDGAGAAGPTPDALAARRDMLAEARDIIDAARERGVTLRLFGGLAVRTHCQMVAFCERDYSDIDLVGRRKEVREIGRLFADLGFRENPSVRFATRNRQLQFFRQCEHPDSTYHYFIHPDDHVDIFLDTFRMDHDVPLQERLDLERYTISLTDVLLTKLQVTNSDVKDLRDIVTLLKDVPLGDRDQPGVIDAAYIAQLCGDDWGMHHDVTAALGKALEALSRGDLGADLADDERERVRQAIARLRRAIDDQPKSRRWRRRARIGERKPWSNLVEEQDGADHGPPLPDLSP